MADNGRRPSFICRISIWDIVTYNRDNDCNNLEDMPCSKKKNQKSHKERSVRLLILCLEILKKSETYFSISQINFINNLSFIFKDEKWIVVHLAPGIVPHQMARTNSVWETSRIQKPSLQTKD